ncbi:MAG: hypothetical protein A3F31_01115 [Candidatus Levybacteria bacterium RIFCSPHIGHO2_12_FULL_38_12]|nr:MAG: hypothetical protein A2770_01815 [Candidatus Levybacteria bacterium RIFCSPHIGHO2_01_FULL_38_12]OGH22033.1 MAG: hypothetical protein A3D75_03345 [Candidatus Levybacteria bacterium RIFCSPHIGHO2_02_FULL_37_18]OGH23249.1 MAG: hypothetical protein A3F31_01115 [Candidatus Levybacteria bacterium RIFCSPHIGHO2_12_FULL_38_12]OGH33726.1 MAG: hypothetical protein A3A47_02780 [Candidatus Levybacteria bacterium RIFCSPLOWO2_01_FULL_37_20]OGH44632.1 MAG: hypothetical protein A3J14_00865 [Candidatus Lev
MNSRIKKILESEIDPAFAKRARLIFECIEQIRPVRVLDAGCGRGFYLQALENYRFIKEIHGVDINESYLSVARNNKKDRRVHIKNANIYKLPYPNGYFDLVICSELLEHLKSDVKGLREIKRVLKAKGILVITVPNKNFPFLWDPLNWVLMKFFNIHVQKDIWWLAGIWADHERLYEKKDLLRKIKKEFTVVLEKDLINLCWPFSHFILYGIGKNIIERLSFKKFDRFNFRGEEKTAKLIAKIFSLPSNLLDGIIKLRPSMNLFVICRK